MRVRVAALPLQFQTYGFHDVVAVEIPFPTTLVILRKRVGALGFGACGEQR